MACVYLYIPWMVTIFVSKVQLVVLENQEINELFFHLIISLKSKSIH